MKSRTVTVIVVAVLILGAVYGITAYQKSAKVREHLAALNSDDTAAVVKAIDGLSAGGQSVVNQVAPGLTNQDPQVRSRAVVLIGLCGGSQDAGLVQKLLTSDEDKFVRRDAAVALGNMGADSAVADLTGVLNDENEDVLVRAGAARALARLREAAAAVPLTKLLAARPPKPAPVPEGEEAEPVEDLTLALRVAAAEALGWLARGDAAAITELGNALADDPDKTVRQAAATSLGFVIADNSDTEELEQAVAALLDAGIEDEEGDVRTAVVMALGRSGTISDDLLRERLQTAISTAEQDDHYWVREAAASARQTLPPFETSA